MFGNRQGRYIKKSVTPTDVSQLVCWRHFCANTPPFKDDDILTSPDWRYVRCHVPSCLMGSFVKYRNRDIFSALEASEYIVK
jgi:hypothetical protein